MIYFFSFLVLFLVILLLNCGFIYSYLLDSFFLPSIIFLLIMTFNVPYYHLAYLKRFFLFLIMACILISFLLGVPIFINPRTFNHFIFQVKQPLRYIEYYRSGYPVQNIDCLLSARNKTFSYDDITRIPVDTQSIFFLETSCKHEAGVKLSPRQACSVESAAKMNPSSQVYVMIISSVRNRTLSPVIRTLYEYNNVKVIQVNLKTELFCLSNSSYS